MAKIEIVIVLVGARQATSSPKTVRQDAPMHNASQYACYA